MGIYLMIFLAIFFLAGGMLNYLDTGKIYKILPDDKLRFWVATILMSFFGTVLWWVVLNAPALN